MPEISVILPVYNAENFIEESVRSTLNQTFADFELIVLDDCSTDNTKEILNQISDPRIVLVRNQTNLKVVKTLDKGLGLARGEYIARMDAGDISLRGVLKSRLLFFTTIPKSTSAVPGFKPLALKLI